MQIHSSHNHTKMMYAYSYYLCRATSLPNVRQHHLPNLDPPPQLPTFGSTASVVRTVHHLNTWASCAMSMGWIWALGHDDLCPCLTTDYVFRVFLSAFDDTLEICRSQRKIIFHPSFFLSFIKKTLLHMKGKCK